MKKTLFAAAACLCIAQGAAFAQDNMEPFNHLSIGVEAGLMGAGVELAMPVQKHLVIKAGYNFLPYSYSTDVDLEMDPINSALSEMRTNQYIAPYLNGISFDNATIDAKAKPKLDNYKILLEYYPSSNHTFHITAGLYFGSDAIVDIDGYTDERTWSTLNTLNSNINQAVAEHPEAASELQNQVRNGNLKYENGKYQFPLEYEIDGTLYEVLERNGLGYANAKIQTNKVKPYLGIGFGRSIPNNRFGFQFDLGCWFHGTPKIVSPNGDIEQGLEDSGNDAIDIIRKVSVWPQISFRLVGRIF